jgi:hypothetical protein
LGFFSGSSSSFGSPSHSNPWAPFLPEDELSVEMTLGGVLGFQYRSQLCSAIAICQRFPRLKPPEVPKMHHVPIIESRFKDYDEPEKPE